MKGQNLGEDWVKKEVKKILKEYGTELRYFMPVAGQFGKVGVHDFIVCQRGFYWTIETKAGRNAPTDQQIDFANDIILAGGICLCINEFTLNEVRYTCDYIQKFGKTPSGHNFEAYRK